MRKLWNLFSLDFSCFFVELGEMNVSKKGWADSEDPLLTVRYVCMNAGSGNIKREGSACEFPF